MNWQSKKIFSTRVRDRSAFASRHSFGLASMFVIVLGISKDLRPRTDNRRFDPLENSVKREEFHSILTILAKFLEHKTSLRFECKSKAQARNHLPFLLVQFLNALTRICLSLRT